MHHRIADLIENGLVHFDVGALELECDLLAKLVRCVTNQSFEPLARLTHGPHGTLGDSLLQISTESRRLRYRLDEIDIAGLSRQLRQSSSRDHELTDQRHQRIEALRIHTNASLSIRYRESRHSRSERWRKSRLVCRSEAGRIRRGEPARARRSTTWVRHRRPFHRRHQCSWNARLLRVSEALQHLHRRIHVEISVRICRDAHDSTLQNVHGFEQRIDYRRRWTLVAMSQFIEQRLER